MTSERAVLLVRRDGLHTSPVALARAMAPIVAAGYELVAVMDPSEWRDAHRLVADDEADVIVRAEPADRDAPDRSRLVRRGAAEVELSTAGVVVPPNQRRPRRVR